MPVSLSWTIETSRLFSCWMERHVGVSLVKVGPDRGGGWGTYIWPAAGAALGFLPLWAVLATWYNLTRH